MQKATIEFTPSTNFEKFVLASLAEIKRQLPNNQPTPTGDYLTPTEVCSILKISKGKFYQFINDGVLTTIKPDPKGRKTYVLRSQVENLFPKDFVKR
ncbi:helix-turn-helix domain-containing protein [Arcicella sp. LKC2W]|uniref:helix-turn-helix domain-containing protein n=1 Tax=Arcicella sp. LKC2W TaxID=2984198 RepID=UPI002B20201C|nr:helix-turn-helix domain-containing protein [Arcicella sp. LKC2W]MEA5457929.1 helix-turn-helix domain-containing protein [Arcicella sp. LKC2W]